MPRFRIAIPAVVAVDIDAKDAEAALEVARDRQRLIDLAPVIGPHGENPERFGDGAALWPADIRGPWKVEIWDEEEEPMATSDPRHPSYDGPSDEQREAMAERADYAREAEREQLRDAGRAGPGSWIILLLALAAAGCEPATEPRVCWLTEYQCFGGECSEEQVTLPYCDCNLHDEGGLCVVRPGEAR